MTLRRNSRKVPWKPPIIVTIYQGRQSSYGPHKKGLNTKIHLAVDTYGMPARMLVASGTAADCSQTAKLIEGIDAKHLLADKGYDVDAIIKLAVLAGMSAVISSKRNRKIQREHDKDLYKLWHLVENAFMILTQWRGIATRYAKNASSFLAAVHIRCIAI